MAVKKTRQFSLGDGLGIVLKRIGKDNPETVLAIKNRLFWEKVVSEEVLNHTDTVIFDRKKGEMVVYVDSQIWAAELTAQKELYRMRINHHYGDDTVNEIRFRISREVKRNKEIRRIEKEDPYYRIDNVPSVSLTEEELEKAEDSVSGIKDLKLRKALLKAMIKDLEWKKGIWSSKRL